MHIYAIDINNSAHIKGVSNIFERAEGGQYITWKFSALSVAVHIYGTGDSMREGGVFLLEGGVAFTKSWLFEIEYINY